MDSGSTDGTAAIARRHGARVLSIPAESFRYGRALNVGFAATATPCVASLNAHAVPVGDRWLRALVDELVSSPGVAAVVGREIPRGGCHPWQLRRMLACYPARAVDLGPQAGLTLSNATALYRREASERLPFDEEIEFAEDLLWQRAALRRGWRLRFTPAAVVEHSHALTLKAFFARQRDIAAAAARYDPLGPSGYAHFVARDLLRELPRDATFLVRNPRSGVRAAVETLLLRRALLSAARLLRDRPLRLRLGMRARAVCEAERSWQRHADRVIAQAPAPSSA